jgi:hypothetical protein
MRDYGRLSRYSKGVIGISHKGVTVTTSVGTSMDDVISSMESSYNYKKGRIPIMHSNRPDLISNTFYSSPSEWWFLLQFNGVTDPFDGFNSGDPILLPTL